MTMAVAVAPRTQEELEDRNTRQRVEALSPDNRHFYWEKDKSAPPPTEDQLMEYYIKNGGATGFAKRVKEREEFLRSQAESQAKGGTGQNVAM